MVLPAGKFESQKTFVFGFLHTEFKNDSDK